MTEPVTPAEPGHDPRDDPAWRSYLMPGTDVLRNTAGLTHPVAVRLFDRIVSAVAEAELRLNAHRPHTLDLAHLCDIHLRLFRDVYPFAGLPRYVDIAKPGQTGEPFVHHRWIDTYAAAVVEQLRAQQNLTHLGDAGQWADRAAYFWASMLHAHPFPEGTGRAVRIWMEDLAAAAGHRLEWTRSSAERNVNVAAAGAHGDYEPMRALLRVVAGAAVGTNRPIEVLDDLDRLQHAEAWRHVGLVFGSDTDRAALPAELSKLARLLREVTFYADAAPTRLISNDQPAVERWRGLAASIQPELPRSADWPQFAADLDEAAAAGIDVADVLSRITARDTAAVTVDHDAPAAEHAAVGAPPPTEVAVTLPPQPARRSAVPVPPRPPTPPPRPGPRR